MKNVIKIAFYGNDARTLIRIGTYTTAAAARRAIARAAKLGQCTARVGS